MTRLVRCAAAATLLLGLAVLATCGDTPPHSHAQRIGALSETIGGPHAIGRVGDFLLENDQIRLIISDVGPGRVNTPYGGSLVDADLQRVGATDATTGSGSANGNDELAELLPGFLFEVINPISVTITADGTDGGPAEVTVTGVGGDLLQMVALLDTALLYPPGLQLTQTYRLYPGKKYVEIETTITNTSTGAHPFPYLDPANIMSLGFDVPGVENLQLSAPLGQLPLFGGEQDLFAPGPAGFNVHFAIEDTYPTAKGFPAFPGMVIDFLATRGKGVSYGLTTQPSPSNYVNTFAALYSNQNVTPYSMVVPFTYAGVSVVYMANPPAMLEPQQQFSFTSDFVIGKGDVGSVLDSILDLRQASTGTFGGRVIDAQTSAPVVGANVLVLDANNNPVDQLQTDIGGAFLGHLAPGSYTYRVLADDRLTTDPQPIAIVADQLTSVFVQFAAPATLAVSVLDEQGRHPPCKVLLIGHFDPSHVGQDARTFLYSFQLGERQRPTAFDGVSNAFIENAWWTVDGNLETTVRPGTYDVVISRGPEYEQFVQKDVVFAAGSFAAVSAQLVRAYDAGGWVAGDFHLHAQASTDSGLGNDLRVTSCAAEGLDVAVATDHNFVTDYQPVIAALGLDTWILGFSGMELTTFEMGHFIGYPLKVDPGSTRGGEFVWAGNPPEKLFEQLRDELSGGSGLGLVTVAHPRQTVLGYFAQFFIDQDTAAPYTPTGLLGVFAPYGDEFSAANFSYDFDSLEVLTGNHFEDIHTYAAPDPLPAGPFPDPQPVPGQIVLGPDGRPEYPGTVETWFTMLDHGLQPTGMGTSDSHQRLGDEPGYARTMLWVGADKATPGGFAVADIVAAIRAHRTIATNAPLLELTIGTAMIGDTVTGNASSAHVHVRSPSWAPVDHLVLYTNGGKVVVDQPIPQPAAGVPLDYATDIPLNFSVDSWLVAEVTGTASMFPVVPPTELPPLDATVIIKALSIGLNLSALPVTDPIKPSHTHISTPYALTNPIRIDVDGGGWTPPKSVITRDQHAPRATTHPDVRAQFAAMPEISP